MVKAPKRGSKTQNHAEEDIARSLPHMLFSNMSHHYRDVFEDIFRIGATVVENTKDPMKPVTLTKVKWIQLRKLYLSSFMGVSIQR